jgi:hypothetical protein
MSTTVNINTADHLSVADINSYQQSSSHPRTSGTKEITATADAQVTLSITAQIQAMSRTGASVGQLAAMFQMPTSSVQDDLGMFPVSTRTTIKSAPIADPNNPQQTPIQAKPGEDDHSDARVELSTTAQVQSMSQSGANLQQIAAALGLTVSQVSEELGLMQTPSATLPTSAK